MKSDDNFKLGIASSEYKKIDHSNQYRLLYQQNGIYFFGTEFKSAGPGFK